MGSGNKTLRLATYVEKGGVGKTTSAAHIATAAAQNHGLDVLLIDLAGTQNDLATQFGIGEKVKDPDAPISAIFGENWEFIRENIPDVSNRMVFETSEGPDLIPADSGLTGADQNLANVPKEDRYWKLDEFLEKDLGSEYDLVIMDLPGKEDNISLNGLFAAENIVVPLKPGKFEQEQLENLGRSLSSIRSEHQVNPEIVLVVPTMIDLRIKQHKQFIDELREQYPDITASSFVKSTANIGNEQAVGRTLFSLTDEEIYSSGREAREAYQIVTKELLEKL